MERVAALLLCSGLILEVSVGTEAMPGPGSVPDPERGRMELRRVQNLAAQPQFGECWTRALENLETRCKEMTSESQSRLALRFTHCHLSSAGRDFPSCPEGSEVSRCTAGMDPVAFNAFTEFFTHTHSICHFLQSEAWQSRAESTMYRLTETSAGVAEQLQATRQMANDLMEAQTDALQAQKEILSNGEQLRVTMRDSTQGLQALFSDLSSVSREQQVALSEIFNRISFMQSFLLMEAHSLSSCCYNAAALCTAYLLTSTPRSSRARLVLLALVCLNFYLERKIYQFVLGSLHPEHLHMELVSAYVGVLRRVSVGVAVCALLVACVRYRDPVQQSLQVLQQLRETHRNLQEALQLAERLTKEKKKLEDCGLHVEVRSAGGCTPEAPAAV
uniref:Protein brambleberry n=1 Tax=Fundulus heteroclitus TaxID=8078 RepID=A0A3Q2TIT0_FUNHE